MAAFTLSEKLDQLGARYDELTRQLSTSEIVSDTSHFQKVAKQHAELEQIVEKHREFKQIEKDLAGAHQMITEAEDSEMKQMAYEEEKLLVARFLATEFDNIAANYVVGTLQGLLFAAQFRLFGQMTHVVPIQNVEPASFL